MKRYVAALLVVVGVVGLVVGVLADGRGFAEDENASRAKCSDATLQGTYLLPLFTLVRGIDFLGSPYPRSCIASPRYPKKHPLQALCITPSRYRL
jgi:hypothetical protein